MTCRSALPCPRGVNRHGFGAVLILAAAPGGGQRFQRSERPRPLRGEHPEGGVQAPVVEPVEPGHGRELDFSDVLHRADVERARADGLGLERADDRLHEAFVVGVGVADGADRGGEALEGEVFGKRQRGVHLDPLYRAARRGRPAGFDRDCCRQLRPGRHRRERQFRGVTACRGEKSLPDLPDGAEVAVVPFHVTSTRGARS